MSENNEDCRENLRCKLITKLIACTRKESLNSMRAEDMAKKMEISKVTMYKYFSSKDEILTMIIKHYKDYIHREADAIAVSEDSFVKKYQKTFEQSLFLNFYFPETFLKDFKKYNPNLHNEILDVQQFRMDQLTAFYKDGAENAVFIPINTAIFILNDELTLRHILNPSFLISNGLSLETALNDYYDMNKRLLLRQEYLLDIDDTPIKEIFKLFVCKNCRNL